MRWLVPVFLCVLGASCGDSGLPSVPADLGGHPTCVPDCAPGTRCTAAGCVAEPDLGSPCGASAECGGRCVDLTTDPANCGSCGRSCASQSHVSSACTGGVCSGVCADGFADCDGNKMDDGCEVNVAGDPDNCGVGGATGPMTASGLQGAGCGVSCPPVGVLNLRTRTCDHGLCAGDCGTGYADCNRDKLKDGCETRVGDDPKNCGVGGATGNPGPSGLPGLGCGVVCSSNHLAAPSCGAGICNGVCDAFFADCDGDKLTNGCEKRVDNDPDNCGAGGAGGPLEPGYKGPQGAGCGVACSGQGMQTRTCSGGLCDGLCAPGFADCDKDKQKNGCETDLRSSDNCGGCNVICAAPLGCVNYQCVPCVGGLSYCDGYCVDFANDLRNCGSCGHICAPNLIHCINGMCSM